MHFSTIIVAASALASTAFAAPEPKCRAGARYGGFKPQVYKHCYITTCDEKILSTGAYSKRPVKNIQQCITECDNSGDCLNMDFNKSTGICRLYAAKTVRTAPDDNYDRAYYSEFDQSPCQ